MRYGEDMASTLPDVPEYTPIRSRPDAIEHLVNAATTAGERAAVIPTAQALAMLVDDQAEDDPGADLAAHRLLLAALGLAEALDLPTAVRALRKLGQVDDDEFDELGVEV